MNGEDYHQAPSPSLVRLHFPPGYPITSKGRYEPATAIRQFSTGRSHVLGLADNGKVWMWYNINQHGWNMRPLHVDLVENGPASGGGRVTQVVAGKITARPCKGFEQRAYELPIGWDKSTIYVNGTGIIYWPYREPLEGGAEEDTLEFECFTVPGTGYRQRDDDRNLSSALEIGEVTNHIVLERYIVFKTRLNKVFLYDTTSQSTKQRSSTEGPIEITSFSSPNDQILDVQGSFRNFAVFTASGRVLIAGKAFLDAVHSHGIYGPSAEVTPLPQPTIIPALQNTNVISLAFGDYHFHALHSTGIITSWGRESRACGALGLGNRPSALLRGVRPDGGFAQDGWLEANKIRLGRSIWFEKEKRSWLQDMVTKASQPEAAARWRMINDSTSDAHIVMSEWFEREGRAWAANLPSSSSSSSSSFSSSSSTTPTTPPNLPAFFALKVSAAGWHSGALILVDDDKAARVQQQHVLKSAATQAAELEREFDAEWDDELLLDDDDDDDDGPGSDEEDGPNGPHSPFEQLEIALLWYWACVVGFGRWVLGLGTRGKGAGVGAGTGTGTGVASMAARGSGMGSVGGEGGDDDDGVVYVWRDRPFPRLRLPGGEEMPGSVPLTEWRGGEPDWGTGGEVR